MNIILEWYYQNCFIIWKIVLIISFLGFLKQIQKDWNFSQKDHINIYPSLLHEIPNYPPIAWRSFCREISVDCKYPIKLVYVGAISMETMYFIELLNWIKKQDGKLVIDIYSFQYDKLFVNFVKSLNCSYINLPGKLNYLDLPMTLPKYDVGLILYKGTTFNYISNAPNKLFEYYSLGLDIWISKEILGSSPYLTYDTYPSIKFIDYTNLHITKVEDLVNKAGLKYRPSEFYCEEVYLFLKEFIFNEKR